MYTFKLPDMDPCGEEEVRPKPRPFVFAGPPTRTMTGGWADMGGGGVDRPPIICLPPPDNDAPFEVTLKEGIIPNKWDDPKTYFSRVPIGGYPYKLNVNGLSKLLWYLDYDGNPILPRTIVPILQGGCIISTYKPEITERVAWVAPNVFVMPWHLNDVLIQDLLGGEKCMWGAPIYATTGSVANYRKMKRAHLTRKCDDEGVHHEVH